MNPISITVGISDEHSTQTVVRIEERADGNFGLSMANNAGSCFAMLTDDDVIALLEAIDQTDASNGTWAGANAPPAPEILNRLDDPLVVRDIDVICTHNPAPWHRAQGTPACAAIASNVVHPDCMLAYLRTLGVDVDAAG